MAAGPYNYSYIFKYIIIGDMGVGKSCLLHQFTEKKCKYTVVDLVKWRWGMVDFSIHFCRAFLYPVVRLTHESFM